MTDAIIIRFIIMFGCWGVVIWLAIKFADKIAIGCHNTDSKYDDTNNGLDKDDDTDM